MSASTAIAITTAHPSDFISIAKNNQLVTNSRYVAQYFSKRHSDVISKIKSLDCSVEFGCTNFSAYPYQHEQNGETYEVFQMTKDGFMFLVMSFTGKRAAAIKEAYINAFNEMAKQLQRPAPIGLNLAAIAELPLGTRSLLHVDETGAHIRPININGKSLVNIDAVDAIQRDILLIANALTELNQRLKVFHGEYSVDTLKQPII